jgi:hypothetical protein
VYVTIVSFGVIIKKEKWSLKQADLKKEKDRYLLFFNNDFKRTGQSSGWADSFTIGAPMAIFSLDDSNRIPF